MRKLFIMIAAAFALSACHMDEHAAGEAIFKNKGSCCGQCQGKMEKQCKCKSCPSKKHEHGKHENGESSHGHSHSHDKGACGLRKTGKSSKSHGHGARACASHTH